MPAKPDVSLDTKKGWLIKAKGSPLLGIDGQQIIDGIEYELAIRDERMAAIEQRLVALGRNANGPD